MITSTPRFRLSNDTKIPILGFGTWRSTANECYVAVQTAIDVGYRHIDTAYVYENEKEVGEAIKSKIDEGKIKREDIYVCTKLPNIHHDPQEVERSCRASLSKLKLEYIDLYVIHFPVGQIFHDEDDETNKLELSDVDYLSTWKAMEYLVDKNLVRSIGLSNFNSEQITRILQNCRIRPVVNQVECHPGYNQKHLIKFCRNNLIHVVAYCPLGRPDPERKCPAFIYDNTIKKLAAKYNKTPAQMCLRYIIQIGAYPIPKSVKRDRIYENYNVLDFIITAEDMEIIDQYNNNRRLIPFSVMKDHKYYPFNIPF